MNDEWVWIMIIACTGIWGFVAIVRIVADAIVRTKQAKAEIEREYLEKMMVEIQEIKLSLSTELRQREPAA